MSGSKCKEAAILCPECGSIGYNITAWIKTKKCEIKWDIRKPHYDINAVYAFCPLDSTKSYTLDL